MAEPTRIIGDKAQRSAFVPAGGTTIAAKRIVIRSGSGVNQIAAASTAAQAYWGITTAALTVTASQAAHGNVQIRDKGIVTSGAAIAIGDRLTSDASGKAIPAAAGNAFVGIAMTAATGVDLDVEVEIVTGGPEMP